MSNSQSIWCELFGHNREYTPEYENAEGHAQADSVCIRCGDVELAWIGPHVNQFEPSEELPSKQQAHQQVKQ